MTADLPDDRYESQALATLSSQPGPPDTRIHRGSELVALSERFNHGIFIGALGFVALSTLAALAMLPLRESAEHGRPPLSAVTAALVVLALTAAALWRAQDVYRLLQRHRELEVLPVLVAAALLSVVSPLRNELWWPACAILMVIALQSTLRRALAYCLVVLLANLIAHVVAGSLSETSPVGIVGLWIGLPFWTAMAAVIPDRMATHILRLNATRDQSRVAPRRVRAWSPEASSDPSPAGDHRVAARTDAARSSDPASAQTSRPPAADVRGDLTSRLTTRQLQVVALLAEGHRYEHIGACLSITAGQVHRHVRNAVARLKVHNVNELVAVAVAEGVVPPPAPTLGANT